MVNPWAGEVGLVIDGEPRVLKLTLGALAELEAQMQAGSILELVQRFETGTYSANDVLALVVAGLRGGGTDATPDHLLTADIEGGLVAAATAAGELLARAFTVPVAS